MELLSRETSYTCRTLPDDTDRLKRFAFLPGTPAHSRQSLAGLPIPYEFALHPGLMSAAMQGLLPAARMGLLPRDMRVLPRCYAGMEAPPVSTSPPEPPKTLSPKMASKPIKFSIDDILGLKDNADDKDVDTADQRTDGAESDMSDLADVDPDKVCHKDTKGTADEEENSQYSWLQCTRYKPPKLPRTKKKEGVKKRKLGRNPRVPFTQHQVKVLEQKFRQTHYLSSVDVAELSAALSLTETRVKIWFQNRRARERRDRETAGHQNPDQGDGLDPGCVGSGQSCVGDDVNSLLTPPPPSHHHPWPKLSPPDARVVAQFSAAYYSCSSAFSPVPFCGFC
ncbi:hypothetical protein LSAT2_022313 [Lamellibrachia satsuma]|nr:hypothetical protein LSAT2_022313 [Lamellibrachia satsuma]